MGNPISPDRWVYILVQNPERDSQILGLHDAASGVSFIPVFMEKETAQRCQPGLVRTPGTLVEAQAIIFEDLERYAGQSGSLMYVLDVGGGVQEKIAPA